MTTKTDFAERVDQAINDAKEFLEKGNWDLALDYLLYPYRNYYNMDSTTEAKLHKCLITATNWVVEFILQQGKPELARLFMIEYYQELETKVSIGSAKIEEIIALSQPQK